MLDLIGLKNVVTFTFCLMDCFVYFQARRSRSIRLHQYVCQPRLSREEYPTSLALYQLWTLRSPWRRTSTWV